MLSYDQFINDMISALNQISKKVVLPNNMSIVYDRSPDDQIHLSENQCLNLDHTMESARLYTAYLDKQPLMTIEELAMIIYKNMTEMFIGALYENPNKTIDAAAVEHSNLKILNIRNDQATIGPDILKCKTKYGVTAVIASCSDDTIAHISDMNGLLKKSEKEDMLADAYMNSLTNMKLGVSIENPFLVKMKDEMGSYPYFIYDIVPIYRDFCNINHFKEIYCFPFNPFTIKVIGFNNDTIDGRFIDDIHPSYMKILKDTISEYNVTRNMNPKPVRFIAATGEMKVLDRVCERYDFKNTKKF